MTFALGEVTGRVETRICSRCGRDVPHIEMQFGFRGRRGTAWTADAHKARCGAFCMSLEVARAGGVAAHTFPECVSCDAIRVLLSTGSDV